MQKMQPEETESADIVSENIERLKDLFPEAFSEADVNFDVLRQLLGDAEVLDESEEKYGLNWHGKGKARQIALTPSTGTLLPCSEESVNWDTTKNLFIEGDNLEVLKLLQKSYANRVKMIYIDPPYNTGKEFIYPDRYQENLDTYLKLTGQADDEGLRFSSNTDSSGRFHTNWLNMMYPRLRVARSLLKDDGVLLVSIDDNELGRLKSLLEEIFGQENYIATLIWNKQHSQQQGAFKRYHEYIIVFGKRAATFSGIFGGDGVIDAGALKKITKANPASSFSFPAGVRFEAADGTIIEGTFGGSEKVTVENGRLICAGGVTAEPVTLNAGWTQKNQMRSWFSGEETIDSRGQKVLEFYFSSTGKLKCKKARNQVTPPTILPEYGMVSESTTYLSNLMGANVFPTPKPVGMMKDFVKWFTAGDDIVMDFFAGSCSSAHGLMEQNTEDEGSRRFIMIQLPVPFDLNDSESEAAIRFCDTLGRPRNIAELSKERLRKAGEAISRVRETQSDLGFKVFRLASSNIQAWTPDRRDLEKTLLGHVEHLVEGRKESDVLYELLLKRGVDLVVPIESREFAGKTTYSIGNGVIFACLDESITKDQIEEVGQGIVEWHQELVSSSETHVFFRDSAFSDDVSKTNMVAILDQNGITHVRSL